MAAAPNKLRPIVWTASFVAIAAVGAISGSELKATAQMVQKQRARAELTPAEAIADLQNVRAGLMSKKIALENKIQKVESRQNGASREESAHGRERRREQLRQEK